jgi:riboflavin synthase
MFTGLIEHLGLVHESHTTAAGVRLVVSCKSLIATEVAVGDSIAIDGCCLTVATQPAQQLEGCLLAFDVIPQTLSLTTLGEVKPGQRVHVEPALLLGAKMGGHIVQGHVDCVGKVLAIDTTNGWRVRIASPPQHMNAVVPQGSVTVAGVSLTIAACDVDANWLEVALIPTTLEKTTFRNLRVGSVVNIECDMIAKQVAAIALRMLAKK